MLICSSKDDGWAWGGDGGGGDFAHAIDRNSFPKESQVAQRICARKRGIGTFSKPPILPKISLVQDILQYVWRGSETFCIYLSRVPASHGGGVARDSIAGVIFE